MSLGGALEYSPDRSTYAIRIFFSSLTDRQPLMDSPFFKQIAEYVFDDNDVYPFWFEQGSVWFDDDIAERMIGDFIQHKEGVEALLVHCSLGESRSPAVAMALNEIFELGHDVDFLKSEYEKYNRHVYETMMRVAASC